jgi:hypothetical protein
LASHLLVRFGTHFAASLHFVKVANAMTILGKFFTTLVFVMSIIFMAFSVMVFVTHRNWRDYATNPNNPSTPGLKEQLEQRRNEVKNLQQKLQEVENTRAAEQAARRQVLAALQTKLARVEKDLQAKERELTEIIANHAQAATALASSEARMTTLTADVEMNRNELTQTRLDRDKQFLNVVAQNDAINQAIGMRTRLEERSKQLSGQVTQLTHILKVHGVAMKYPPDDKPPTIEGKIKAIGASDLVEITIGHDDGLKQGHQLDIYRGSKYVGRLVIRKTQPDSAVGQLIKDQMRDQAREGDNVSTKFG